MRLTALLFAAAFLCPLTAAASAPTALVRSDWTPESLRQAYQEAVARFERRVDKLAAVPHADARFANTVKEFEDATSDWHQEFLPMNLLSSVSPDEAIRKVARELAQDASRRSSALMLREDLANVVEAAAAKNETLDEVDARLLAKTLEAFRKGGQRLPLADRQRLQVLQARLTDISSRFAANLAEHRETLDLDPSALAGLSPAFIAGLERTPEGLYRVPVEESSMRTFMREVRDPDARRRMDLLYQNRAPQNVELVREALEVRRDIAQLLGYPGHAEMTLEDRMAKTPAAVLEFLERVRQVVVPRAHEELARLLEIKRRDAPEAERVESWDLAYYGRRYVEERHGLDSEALREYFPADKVVAGTLSTYELILGLRFAEVPGAAVWAPEVKLYAIFDAASGRRIGHFYLDLYPRAGKRGGAAAAQVIGGRRLADGSYQEPVSVMMANFPRPSGGRPALLYHDNVRTFFHEFGHIMHQTLTTARYGSMSGSRTARDFVEAPSQMLENMIWERVVLDRISGHWRDDSKIPDELLRKMRDARDALSGTGYAFQLGLASADMVLHTTIPQDVSATFNRVVAEATGIVSAPGANRVAGFSHLFGYGAGYYGYLWSKVFAQDIYTRFEADGVLSPRVGGDYRREILERGSERDEADSIRAFLGRQPSPETFMRQLRGRSDG